MIYTIYMIFEIAFVQVYYEDARISFKLKQMI